MGCVVCGSAIEGDDVRVAGVATRRIGAPDDPARQRWVWGPVPVHDACRPRLATPYDDQLGVPEGAVCGGEYLVAASEVAVAGALPDRSDDRAAAERARPARRARHERVPVDDG